LITSKLTALLVGDVGREEFHDARELLRRRSRLVIVPSVIHACAWLGTTATTFSPLMLPDVIVLAQSRPGQYTMGQIERLRRLAPLARIVGLLGSWCEGEPRTGQPWPAAIRFYWYDWAPRLNRELDQHAAGRCAMWSLPDTISSEEQLGWLTDKESPACGGRILVCTRTWDLADALHEACRRQGYGTERICLADGSLPRTERATPDGRFIAAIWEGTQCSPQEVEQLRRMAEELPGIPILALLDFPRTYSRQWAKEAGAACVISKPFLLDDLFALVRIYAIQYDE
jgi:hypothetical protein